MPTFEEWIAITTTPEVVERHLTDPQLMERWMSALQLIEPLAGTWMQQGSSMRVRFKIPGLPYVDYTVVERTPGRIVFALDGLLSGTYERRWFADGNRTMVQARIDYEVPNPALRPFFVYFGQLFSQVDLRVELNRLRQLIETGSADPRPDFARA